MFRIQTSNTAHYGFHEVSFTSSLVDYLDATDNDETEFSFRVEVVPDCDMAEISLVDIG